MGAYRVFCYYENAAGIVHGLMFSIEIRKVANTDCLHEGDVLEICDGIYCRNDAKTLGLKKAVDERYEQSTIEFETW